MIKIINLSKSYKNRKILDNLSIELPNYGLICILGPSGCGKTTLLNCLAGLITDYSGQISIDGRHLSSMSEDELSKYRIYNYGFIFQDYKLFEFESVMNNVLFPLDTISNIKRSHKERKCKDLISLVDLNTSISQPVYKLSGGEKQRVAIARALVNDPKIVLADEPTGSLDSVNSSDIMKVIEKISKKSLVVMVTHDHELADKYADKIIRMQDGKIIEITDRDKDYQYEFIPVRKNLESNKKAAIPVQFLLKHTFFNIKKRKWRTMICATVTSLGLIGVGLAVNMSSSISSNIKAAYSSIVDDSKIMITKKKEGQTIYGTYACNYYEANYLAKKYPDYVNDVGINYYVNFEEFFPDCNEIAIASTTYRSVIEGISIRHVNEFQWLEDNHKKVYPNEVIDLKDDEAVFGLSVDMIENICFALRIERSVGSLSNYLEKNELLFYFDVANDLWQYSDQQLLRMKGFTLESDPVLYHTNHKWNEYFYETQMRFPVTDMLSVDDAYPWVMKKMYYFHTFGNTDDFISLTMHDPEFEPYLLEIANTKYYPWLYRNVPVEERNRVIIFLNTLNSIDFQHANYFMDHCSNIRNPIYGSTGGYAIYPSSLMMGFSHFTYFSCSEETLNNVIDANESLSLFGNETSELPPGVISGHFSKTRQAGVTLKSVNDEKLFSGRLPNNLDEIVISTKMARELLGSLDVSTHELLLSTSINERLTGNNELFREFMTKKLKIVGLVDDPNNVIYHYPEWSICFFQSRLGISIFDLSVNTISFDVIDKNEMDKSIKDLSLAFPKFEIINPLQDVNEGVDKVCSYIRIALMCFSIIAVIISSLLLTISNYLHVLENKKDVGLSRCIGVNKKESKKFLFYHAITISLISFVLSSIELVGCSFIIMFAISYSMDSQTTFSFNPLSLVLMFLLSLLISIVSSAFISNKITKLSPLEALKK